MSEENKAPDREPLEKEAREQGWVPKDEFRGPEDQWRDAEEFLERGKQINPILRKHNEELKARAERTEKKLEELTTQIQEQRKTFDEYMTHRDKVLEAEYSRKLKVLQKEMRSAVAEGDVDRFDEIQEEIKAVESTKPEPPTQKDDGDGGKPSGPAPEEDPVMQEWLSKNNWYAKNAEMRAAADAYGAGLRVMQPALTGEQFLDAVSEQIQKMYPDQFTNPKKKVGSGVEPAGAGPSESGGDSYEDLPPDAKQICDRFVAEKLMTREQYVKDYFAS